MWVGATPTLRSGPRTGRRRVAGMIGRGARSLLLGAVLVMAAGCGGAPAASDPSGTVQAALGAATTGGLAKLADYTCAAKKGDLASAFGGVDTSALQAAGISLNDL